MGVGSFPEQPRSAFPVVELEYVFKSALFARILEGKRPLPFPPPTRNELPWHELVEGASVTHHINAEILRDDQGQAIGAIIEGCSEWKIIEEISDCEYLVQHRGVGPLFRLQCDVFDAVLSRRATSLDAPDRPTAGSRRISKLHTRMNKKRRELSIRSTAVLNLRTCGVRSRELDCFNAP